ncbi:sugar transporter ERD6-like 16 [Cryptomeria japonica]|uniref:sugar transporter ERD6-like 16 n=1 Tax=Cryptomeria japonica TaxID=3369 RepID=UPI0025ABA0A9|nr:sugar transporter ERD6-like 16 [Cryptomeria japonica]
MTIKIDLENGEISEQQEDIIQALLPAEEKSKNFNESDSTKAGNDGSIQTVLLSTFVVVLGSLEFGYSVGFSSPTQSAMIEDLGLTLSQYSTFGSLLTIGAMIGAITSGRVADSMGRKGALRVASASYIIGWLIIVISKVALPLDIGRLFVGYGVGLTSYTVPVYIAEITPKNLRGALTNTNQLSVTAGILIVYLLGMFVTWHDLAIIGLIPCSILVLGLFFIPESPRWLAKVGREKEFKAALQALRGKGCDVSAEAAEIKEYVDELEMLPKGRVLDLFQRKYAHHVIVGVGLMVFQQLCGINALMFYASKIFEAAGFHSDHAASVSVAALQVPMTVVGVLLMDRAGRRPLLMVSAGGISLGCFMVGVSFYIQGHESYAHLGALVSILALGGLLTYIAAFSLGMGGVPWIIMSEIFPINMKGVAGSLVTLVSWFGSWVITLTFNFLLTWSAAGSFFIFGGAGAGAVLFVAKLLPETKGQTLEEIQTSFLTFFSKRTPKSYNGLQ